MLRRLWKLILYFNGVSYAEESERPREMGSEEPDERTEVIHWDPPPGSARAGGEEDQRADPPSNGARRSSG